MIEAVPPRRVIATTATDNVTKTNIIAARGNSSTVFAVLIYGLFVSSVLRVTRARGRGDLRDVQRSLANARNSQCRPKWKLVRDTRTRIMGMRSISTLGWIKFREEKLRYENLINIVELMAEYLTLSSPLTLPRFAWKKELNCSRHRMKSRILCFCNFYISCRSSGCECWLLMPKYHWDEPLRFFNTSCIIERVLLFWNISLFFELFNIW